MIKNRYVALVYRLFCLVFTMTGLVTNMGILNDNMNLGQFMYYTIQSNLLAFVLFFLLASKTFLDILRNGKDGNAGYYQCFEMACVIDLLLTLFVYWILLAPSYFSMDGDMMLWTFDNTAVHLVVPLMSLFDYFLFTTPGHLKYRNIYYVLIFPLSYVLFSTIAGLLGYVYRVGADGSPVRFPYFFFDWDIVGAMGLLYIIALVVFFLILSHLLYWIDRKRMNRSMRKS